MANKCRPRLNITSCRAWFCLIFGVARYCGRAESTRPGGLPSMGRRRPKVRHVGRGSMPRSCLKVEDGLSAGIRL